jgi:hypothetical protein
MVQFTEVFPDSEIVATLSRQLGWSHFKELLPLKDPLQRDFYAEMCRIERWSVRKLREKIGGMLFERTALSKKPVELAEQELQKLRAENQLAPDLVFRDPYFLDFLAVVDFLYRKIVSDFNAFRHVYLVIHAKAISYCGRVQRHPSRHAWYSEGRTW